MNKPSAARDAIIRAAADLFRRQGFARTGLNEILKRSGAPKGSLYHYFPEGKSQLGVAAISHSGKLVEGTLADLARQASDTGDLVARYVAMLSGWLESSGFRHGNPITSTLLEEAPEDLAVTTAGRDAYNAWIAVLMSRLKMDGASASRAHRVARLIIAALEGACVQARVEQSSKPLLEVAAELRQLTQAAASRPAARRASAGR